MMLVPLFVFFLLAVTGVLSWGTALGWWLAWEVGIGVLTFLMQCDD